MLTLFFHSLWLPMMKRRIRLTVRRDEDPDFVEYEASFEESRWRDLNEYVFRPCAVSVAHDDTWAADGAACRKLFHKAESRLAELQGEDEQEQEQTDEDSFFREEREATADTETLVELLARCVENGAGWFLKCQIKDS